MRDEEHRRFGLPPQLDDQLLHVEARRRIERAERLVHENDARRENERPRNRHALPHAARQLVRELLRVARHVEADLGNPLPRALAPLGRLHAAALEPERHVVLDRAVVERRVVLEDHAAVRARLLDRFVGDEHGAFGRRMVRPQAGDQPQDGRLAATRRPQDRDEFPLSRQVGNRKGHVANDRDVPELLGDAAKLDDVGKRVHQSSINPRGPDEGTGPAGTRRACDRFRTRARR